MKWNGRNVKNKDMYGIVKECKIKMVRSIIILGLSIIILINYFNFITFLVTVILTFCLFRSAICLVSSIETQEGCCREENLDWED